MSSEVVSLTSLFSSSAGTLSDIVNAIRSTDGAKASGARGQPLERDFFNTRKLIVLSTLKGVVFGIDNADGRVVWRLNVDPSGRFAPLGSQLAEETVPLFIQRSAIHLGLPAVAAVAYKDKITGEGIIVQFDAMTGKIFERMRLGELSRVELLPTAGADHLHSIVVVEKSGKVSTFPTVDESSAKKMTPVYVLDVDVASGVLEGSLLSPWLKKRERRWTAHLAFEKNERVVAIKGKPAHQRVHSRGRVLIDRNVNYKYINPNVVAIASVDEIRQTLSIHVVDAVTGQIVHTARVTKATGPVHIVHCEHWIAYSYISDKGRRTELGILELYEGQEEPAGDLFDSQIPTRRKPEVISQSYIFSQGIEAMGVSETDQGVTTRSLIMALPFGGLFEVTRRFIDATRPLEMTQEMREEMMVPYMPEIPIGTEDMLNYNQTVFNIRGIKAFPSGLESTSLMLAHGLDLFYTRLTPSGTFDILKDDFDHLLICVVLAALFFGSWIAKRIVRRNTIKQAWS